MYEINACPITRRRMSMTLSDSLLSKCSNGPRSKRIADGVMISLKFIVSELLCGLLVNIEILSLPIAKFKPLI